ncbi:MAG: DUF952 domain-containing protein [Anaerolineae bacterium]
MIYHITTQTEWHTAQQSGHYRAPSLESEGFIHCSTAEQVLKVANAFYSGRHDLVLLAIDETQLADKVRWEPPAGAPAEGIPADLLFPHIYSALPLNAVQRVLPFQPGADGRFSSLPEA